MAVNHLLIINDELVINVLKTYKRVRIIGVELS